MKKTVNFSLGPEEVGASVSRILLTVYWVRYFLGEMDGVAGLEPANKTYRLCLFEAIKKEG